MQARTAIDAVTLRQAALRLQSPNPHAAVAIAYSLRQFSGFSQEPLN